MLPGPEDDIASLFEDYPAGFDEFDAEEIADAFTFPCIIWQFGKGNVFADRHELMENIEALLDVFEREEIVHSTFQVLALSVSGPIAMATLSWRQEREDGDVALAFVCHYALMKGQEGWGIIQVVNES